MEHVKDTLIFAGGGGGDALAALMVADAFGLDPKRTAFATLVWERTLFDPEPGPRAPEDFEAIQAVGEHNHRITASSRLRGDRTTFVPRLAESFGVSYYLMDVTRGPERVRTQISELQQRLGFDRVLVVDVGGDILARGHEEMLRSPLADGLALAGTHDLDADVRVIVTGLGLDGELSEQDVADVHADLIEGNDDLTTGTITPDTASRFASAFRWLPSEVSGLTTAAALGHRGTAEIRSSGLRVELSDESCTVRSFAHDDVYQRNEIAAAFEGICSIEQCETVLQDFGRTSELEYERRSRDRLETTVESRTMKSLPLEELEADLIDYSATVQEEGVQYLSIRRIAKVLDLQRHELESFKTYLAENHADRFQPPIWTCSASANAGQTDPGRSIGFAQVGGQG
ncbi:DUF1152 domain-containing protein [Longibacter salinarum]|uniref:DUF1152 domain-containing protein n=1 Tax=Longibacter salinarum TaxID=1850348 RepID=UPI0015CF7573|nr:DUF1152 domain-containing protein [Longibacter salinarum]